MSDARTAAEEFTAATLGVPVEYARAKLEAWDVHGYYRDGELAAFILKRGTEIHCAVMKGWRGKTIYRGALAGFLKPMLDERGYLTTRVPHEAAGDQCFVERIGFTETWRDPEFVYYILTALPFTTGD